MGAAEAANSGASEEFAENYLALTNFVYAHTHTRSAQANAAGTFQVHGAASVGSQLCALSAGAKVTQCGFKIILRLLFVRF